jgi:hypothetical protein
MRKLTFSIALSTLATATVALAAPGMGGHKMPQGDVTRAQAEAAAGERFARMDANGDGLINQADREARRAKMIARLDTDKDGTVSAEERAAARANRPEGARAGKRGGDHAGHAGMAGKRMAGRGMGMMKMADTDGNGALSRAEFTAAALKRFDRIDADRNGTVTETERKTAREAMRAQWQARKAAAPAN